MDGSPDCKAEVLEYLSDMRSWFLTYHNHKENMAWAGFVVFLGLLAALWQGSDYIFDKHALGQLFPAGSLDAWERLSVTVGSLVLAGASWTYIRLQFSLRRYAADVNRACYRLSAEILAGGFDWTNFFELQRIPTEMTPGELPADYYLPKRVRDEMAKLDVLRGPVKLLEGYVPVVVCVCTAVVIAVTWLRR
jgi:hypothetical protein